MKPSQPVRRIITAQRDSADSSVFAVDEEVEPSVHPVSGITYWPIYGRDSITQVPYVELEQYGFTMFPSAPTGFRAHVIEFPAAGQDDPQGRGDWPDFGLPPGWAAGPDDQGMHWTNTVDVVIILDGEIGLAQGDGTEVTLHPGCVVVQNGAVHAWRRRDVPCRMVYVNLGAELRDGGAAAG